MAQQSLQSNHQFSKSIWRSLLVTIGATAVLPYVIYQVASPHMSEMSALLLAGIPPAAATLLDLLRSHRLNVLGGLALLGIALNLLTGILFKDARLLLVSYSLMPGVYGTIMLVSVLMGKPILLILIRSTLAGASVTERERLEKRWLANGTSSFMFLTALWGVGLLSVLAISIVLIYTLTVKQYVPLGPIIQYAMFGTLILISHIYSLVRRSKRSQSQFQQHLA